MVDTYQTRGLVEGALLAALTVVLVAMGFFIPWLFFISSILFPVPIILMIYRQGLKKGFLSLITAYFLLLMLYPDPISITIFFMQFSPLGVLFGLLFKNRVSAGKSIFAGTVLAAVLTFVSIGLVIMLTGISTGELESQLKGEINHSMDLYQDINNLSDSEAEEMRQIMEDFIDTMLLLLPSILIIGAMFSTLISYIISRTVLVRLNHDVLPLPPFSHWTYPWYTVWGIIIGLAMMIIGDRYDYTTVATLGKNILYVFSFAFLLLGISVLAFYYKRAPISKGLKWLLIFLAILLPLTPYLVVVMGVLDPLLDIRKLNQQHKEV
ncbi:YybS family protein [Peptococcaceae bacterium 1198_IL3148]